jgi:hypothetical protein
VKWRRKKYGDAVNNVDDDFMIMMKTMVMNANI